MNRIDIGICMCHFYWVAKEKGLQGEFRSLCKLIRIGQIGRLIRYL